MKKPISIKRLGLLVFALLMTATSVFAGTKGKVAGTVVDESGETLVGVQVFIEGTTKGTITDIDGKYSIVNLDPGTYTVVFVYIGFATTKVEEVEVIVDKTTEVNMTMREEVIEGQEIVVTAERPIVEKDRTTTTAYISSKQLEDLPLVSVNEAVNQQAGVVDGHFRGGRTGEVAYLVNGVPINNAYNNSAAFEVEQNMVSSLEVISGVFNAEYGQALSGVVNIVTKGVSNEWSADFLGYTGTIFSGRELEFVRRDAEAGQFLSIDDFSTENVSYTEASTKFANYDVQFSAGGPIIKDKLGFQATARYVKSPGHLIGRNLFSPDDQQLSITDRGIVRGLASNNSENWILESTGDGGFEELNYQDRYSLNTSLVYEVTGNLKIDYNLFLQSLDGRNYDHSYKYNPSGINKYYNVSQNHILGIRYTMGQNSFANFSYSYLNDQGEFKLYNSAQDTELDPRYVGPDFAEQQGQDAFRLGGNYLSSSEDITQTHTIVTDFTSQLNNVVLFKTGLSARFHNIDNESFGITAIEVGGGEEVLIRSINPLANSTLEVSPYEAAGYAQAKFEFEDLIINAGLRFDYFEPDFVVPIDINQASKEFISNPETANPNDSLYNRKAAPTSFQLSPRLGIAFPISETGVMRFSAGLFFQTPQLNLLYTNNEFELNTAGNTTYGNAALKPERTLSFEVGLQQGLSETLGMDLTVYSKDIRNLTGLEVRREGGNFNSRLVNLDYGTVKGATLSLYQRGAGPISWTIDYTLQFASGSSSDPQQNLILAQEERAPIIRINRLNWDRRNVLNNTITWASEVGFTISMINSLQTGTPYTSERQERQSTIPNNEDRPLWFNSDARIFYKPPSLGHDIQLFFQVDNIFDAAPDFSIYNDTGLATESVDLARRLATGSNPGGINSYTEWYLSPDRVGAPRTIKLGLSFKF
jgi:outer membrane receptor protein involved in Fe transport